MSGIRWKLDMFVALGIGRLEGGFGLTPQAHGNPGVLHFENSRLLFDAQELGQWRQGHRNIGT